jgi:hypothetical protein
VTRRTEDGSLRDPGPRPFRVEGDGSLPFTAVHPSEAHDLRATGVLAKPLSGQSTTSTPLHPVRRVATSCNSPRDRGLGIKVTGGI